MSTLNNYQVGGFIFGKDENSISQYQANIDTYKTHLFFDTNNNDLLINGVSFSYSKEARNVDASIIKDIEDIKYTVTTLASEFTNELSNTEYVIVNKFDEIDLRLDDLVKSVNDSEYVFMHQLINIDTSLYELLKQINSLKSQLNELQNN